MQFSGFQRSLWLEIVIRMRDTIFEVRIDLRKRNEGSQNKRNRAGEVNSTFFLPLHFGITFKFQCKYHSLAYHQHKLYERLSIAFATMFKFIAVISRANKALLFLYNIFHPMPKIHRYVLLNKFIIYKLSLFPSTDFKMEFYCNKRKR